MCLPFCLSVSNITEKVMKGLQRNIMEVSCVLRGTSNQIYIAAQVTSWPWQRFVLCEYLEYDDRLWIFGGEGV